MGLLASPLVITSLLDMLILGGIRARLRALCLGLKTSSPGARLSGGIGYVFTSVMALNCTVVVVGEAEGAVPFNPLITLVGMSTSMADIMRMIRTCKFTK